MNIPGSARARQQSLLAHARNAATQDPAYSAQERLRFFAFSRFLARIFAEQSDDWALKGAGALLARIPVARASNDLDLVDIALIACNLTIRAVDLASMWERGFTRLRRAAGPLGTRWPSYTEAVAVAQILLDPVLANERYDGIWDPAKRQWTDEHSESGANEASS
jgi:hypothetical protein